MSLLIKYMSLKPLYIEIYLYKLYTLAQVWVPVADIGFCTKCTTFLYRKLISKGKIYGILIDFLQLEYNQVQMFYFLTFLF